MVSQRALCRVVVKILNGTGQGGRCRATRKSLVPSRSIGCDRLTWSTPTFLELHDSWVKKFTMAGVDEPLESAGYIFAHLLSRKTFSQVPAKSLEYRLSQKEIWDVDAMCQKRLNNMPVQYVIGQWDFFGMTLKMRPPVFIPRPETEELVEHVLADIRCRRESTPDDRPIKVLEIGCGSGAISLGLLRELITGNVTFTAIDAASHAVELTKENCRLLGTDKTGKMEILHRTLGHDEDSVLMDCGPFDIVVSNPPYIPTSDMKELAKEISCYEDELALHGGIDGLDVICNILQHSCHLLKEEGSIWLEVDPTHTATLSQNPFDKIKMVRSHTDVFGKLRFCLLKKVP